MLVFVVSPDGLGDPDVGHRFSRSSGPLRLPWVWFRRTSSDSS